MEWNNSPWVGGGLSCWQAVPLKQGWWRPGFKCWGAFPLPCRAQWGLWGEAHDLERCILDLLPQG